MIRVIIFTLCIVSLQAMAALPGIGEFAGAMQRHDGFIPFYYDKAEDKIYLELVELEKELLFQTSLPRGLGSNDIGLDRGQLGDTRLVKFSRFGNKVLLRQINTRYRAVTENKAEQQSIEEAFAHSVIAGFEVVAADNEIVLIDYTPYLLSDVHGVIKRLQDTKQGTYALDTARSGIVLKRSKGFENNSELEALITFAAKGKPGEYVHQIAPDADSLSVHMHHSFVKLPDSNYEPRVFHPYSGYWKFSFFDYATAITEPMEQKYIIRHRLAKKDPTAKQSEAVEPIVYYLDPGIPEPVLSALKEGASWWNEAFVAIGYKNAFQVKMLPEDADPMDVRYNVIQWVHRATRGWSYGASVVDPRTGELIKGHVTLGSLRVRQDYLIALGLTSPFTEGAGKTDRQVEMALARIRQLSAHEVGHTLGLAHNFAASENNRASVMDYPHPLIEFNNGELTLENAYDEGVGKWDKHAIAYGYQDYSDASEQAGLAQQIQLAKKQKLRYKTDADTRSSIEASGSGHMWDNGGDPISAFKEISAIRKKALENLGLQSIQEGQGLSAIEDVLVPIYLLHRYQLAAVAKQVGGLEYEYEIKSAEQTVKGQRIINVERQKKAIKQILDATTASYLRIPDNVIPLITPTIFGDDITREHFDGRMGRAFDPVSAAEAAAAHGFSLLLAPERLNRLSWQSTREKGLPDIANLIERIFDTHWYQEKQADYGVRERLQLVALNAVVDAASSSKLAPEVRLAIQGGLKKFSVWLSSKSHHPAKDVLSAYLEQYWQTGEWPMKFEVKPLPPGSPI
ncbi:zinc-dependent metalloprotease [Alteromonas sp. ASW11-130]|uniref:zinc-dependent metalloprotease n=1 Tax=Alteromonas sp. ASW11-130 TaxID=3015775 RepID=UPI00224222D7|nr:zinc-dependent metalloprotease [Alteromonas sp. ASW11-130]MCW8090257.1 zinc-dependent metalloprotease [Alteromonas sp. ASW11-130]